MGIQVFRRISFEHTHDTIWDLSYLCFQLILQAKSFVFVLSCGIRVASMPSVDSIPFLNGVLILLFEYQSFMIIEIVMSILFNRRVFSSSGFDHFNIRKITHQFSQRCSFHPSQVAFVFPALPPSSSRSLTLF